MKHIIICIGKLCFLFCAVTLFIGCASKGPYRLNLMPAPDVFNNGAWDLFSDTNSFNQENTIEIFYATGREPATDKDRELFYQNQRGYLLRLGKGIVTLGKGEHTWEEMRKISLLKNRTQNLPMQVTKVKEFGILSSSISEFDAPEIFAQKSEKPGKDYADSINKRLEKSLNKDIYIYVHGFKVNFENPLIVASELWHYLGYNGAFIAFAWPSTPSIFAYASDAETTAVSSRNLRLFLQFLSKETIAEEIHIIGYSAGTRLVADAIHSLALIHHNQDRQAIYQKLRLGHIVLIGSDIDIDIFGNMLHDNILDVPRHMNIYMSSGDKALGFSNWFFARKRLGQLHKKEAVPAHITDTLLQVDELDLIDVSDAEGTMTGNGHGYFRNSPWASSDILVTLTSDLKPDQRGLVRFPKSPFWYFPEDYRDRLKSVLKEQKPWLNPDIE